MVRVHSSRMRHKPKNCWKTGETFDAFSTQIQIDWRECRTRSGTKRKFSIFSYLCLTVARVCNIKNWLWDRYTIVKLISPYFNHYLNIAFVLGLQICTNSNLRETIFFNNKIVQMFEKSYLLVGFFNRFQMFDVLEKKFWQFSGTFARPSAVGMSKNILFIELTFIILFALKL